MFKILKFQLLVLLGLSPFYLKAHDGKSSVKKFTYGFELAEMNTLESPFNNGVKSGSFIKLNFGYNHSSYIYYGISAGYSTYRNYHYLLSLPVELEVKGTLLKKSTSPFAYVKGGYAFKSSRSGNNGTVYSLGMGYQFRIGKNFQLSPIIGYYYQGVNSYLLVTKDDFNTELRKVTDPLKSLYLAVRFEF